MSLHYLLDGYNILKQIPALNDLSLEDGRRGLMRWIETARPQGSVKNTVTVVFDGPAYGGGAGNPDFFSAPAGSQKGVIFSDGSADDKIKLMVEEDEDRRSCVVVSDDKDIVLYTRALGARVMSVRAFTHSKAALKAHPHDGKYISLSRQEKINKELSGIWLKEKQ